VERRVDQSGFHGCRLVRVTMTLNGPGVSIGADNYAFTVVGGPHFRGNRPSAFTTVPGKLCLGENTKVIDDPRVVRVAAGALHSAVLTRCGRVLTFGRGAYGSLGLGPVNLSPFPSPMHLLDEEGSAPSS